MFSFFRSAMPNSSSSAACLQCLPWVSKVSRRIDKVAWCRVCADGSFAVGLFRSANADTRSVPHSRHSIRLPQSVHPAHSRVCSNVTDAIFIDATGQVTNIGKHCSHGVGTGKTNFMGCKVKRNKGVITE